ncbi:MAG: O-antigen ligase family protein [Patescibacteria group bacterium]|jgi:putative inorganic carbon (HCO3(-)) transporter
MLKNKVLKICDFFIEYGILAIVFFIPIIFDYSLSTYNCFDLYKAVIFRVILIFILLAFTAKIFITDQLIYRGSAKIFLLAVFLLLSFFVSSYFSLYPNQSFWGSFLRQQGFYNFFNYCLFFVLIILNINNFQQLKRIIIAIVASSFLVSAYGLIQYFYLDPFYWSDNPIDSGRIFSSLGQPNFLGHWLIMVLPISFYVLIFITKKMLARFFVVLVIVMQFACLVFTYSRAAWLGFMGSILFLVLVWLFYKRFKKITFSLIGLILIGVLFIVGLNVVNPTKLINYNSNNLVNRLKSFTDLNNGSSKMRLYYIKSAITEIKQENFLRLLVGYGPEVLDDVFRKYYNIDWGIYETINSFPDRVHNWPLDQILAFGFLGLMANLIFYIYFIYKAVIFLLNKQKFEPDDWLLIFLSSSLVAYSINNLFSFSLFTVFVYLFLILGICWIIMNYKLENKTLNVRLTVFSKLFIFISLFLVSAVFIYTNNINQVRAEIYYVKALKLLKSSDCNSLINNLEKIVALNPKNNYYQENYLFLMMGCFAGIKDKAMQIQFRDNITEYINLIDKKESYGILHNTARAYSLFGFYLDKSYYAEAEKIFNLLISDFPYFTMVYEDLAKQKMIQEDYQEVVKILNQEIKILPSIDSPYLNNEHRKEISDIAVKLYENLGQAYFKLKNYDLAYEAYKKGLEFDPYRATLYKNIADIYYVQNNLDEAIEFNQRGFMLSQTDYHWPLALSLLYRDKKDLSTAKEYLKKALELAPDNEELKKYKEELNK